MFKIIKRIKYALRNNSSNLMRIRILTRDVTAIRGTVKRKADQDDAWFHYLALKSSCIFDVSAIIGYSAPLDLIVDKGKRIISVDANLEALADAAKNLFVNTLGQNCRFYTGFVGNKIPNNVAFYTVGTGSAGSIYSSHARTAAQLNKSIELPPLLLMNL